MKEIRYWTSHPYGIGNPAFMSTFEVDENRFRFVYDEKDPQCVVASEHIHTDDRARSAFVRQYDPRRLLIFYAGECAYPDMNIFDYAVAFDRDLCCADRIVRRPTLSFFHNSVFSSPFEGCADPDAELARKKGFCNFIYSNPNAHPRRDELFRLLSSYRHVDSLGPHLNNCGNVPSRNDADWREASVRMKSRYKFSIASENAVYPGYVSEKIISSFQAHTVPIYFGDPTVAADFNPRAFINANGLSDAEIIAAVRRVDEDDDLWKRMVSEPAVTAEQKSRFEADDLAYRTFWNNVFAHEIHEVKRAPSGTWPGLYLKNWLTLSHGFEIEQSNVRRVGMRAIWYKLYKHAKKRLVVEEGDFR